MANIELSPDAHELSAYIDNVEPLYLAKMDRFAHYARKCDAGKLRASLTGRAFSQLVRNAADDYRAANGRSSGLSLAARVRAEVRAYLVREFTEWYTTAYKRPEVL